MKNKWLIIPYSMTHFLVDFACALFMYHYAFQSTNGYIFMILYNFCAFALQMPFGLLVDKWNRNAICAAAGCLLVAAAFISRPFLTGAVIILGIGNAFFHVGAGTDVLNSSTKKASLLGIFVSPGAFGIYFGTMLGTKDFMMLHIYPLILLAAAAVILVMDYMSTHSFRSNNVKVSFATAADNKAILAIFCFFLVVLLRSFMGMRKFSWGGEAHWGVYLICAVVFGKALGGIFADLIGYKKVAFFSLALSGVCFAGSSIPVLGVLGILFFNMTMPITLWAIAKILEGCKGFSFGLLTVALFFGILPGCYTNKTALHTGLGSAMIAAVSLVILMTGMRSIKKQACVVLFCLIGLSIPVTAIHADEVDYRHTKQQEEVTDNESFMKIHRDELDEYHGEFSHETQDKDIILWEYPFSSEKNADIREAYSNMEFEYLYLDNEFPDYLWGYVKVDKQTQGWVCFNDPGNEKIATINNVPEAKAEKPDITILVLILVAVLIVVTVVLMRLLGKRERK